MASPTFLPTKDAELLLWAQNFSSLITATPVPFGLTAALATGFAGYLTTFSTDLAACGPGVRSKSAVVAKNAARTAMKNDAALLANLVNGTATVTNTQKTQLGLNVRVKPSPIPAPSIAPNLDVVSRTGTMVTIKLHDGTGSKRGKPAGVKGASIFSYVGATPPVELTGWSFEGNTTKTIVEVNFAGTLPPGTIVWMTAFWFNPRAQSGPGCSPVSAILAGGGMSLAA